MKKNLRNIIIFCIITLASGWIGVLIDSILTDQPQGSSLGLGIWLITPLITSIVLRAVSRDWKDTGLHLHIKGNIKWYLLSILIYPIITVITIGLAIILGWADARG